MSPHRGAMISWRSTDYQLSPEQAFVLHRSLLGAVLATAVVLSALSAGFVGALPTTGRPEVTTAVSPDTPAQSDGQLAVRLQAEGETLNTLLESMGETELLYARLLDYQRERAVLRGQILEQGIIQEAVYLNLTRFLRRFQDDPEKLDALRYEIRQSIDTLAELERTVEAERRLVTRIRATIIAENDTLGNLTTPLAEPLRRQRESQLTGLALLNESLGVQAQSLFDARVRQVERAEIVGFYQPIWREIDTQQRKELLREFEADISATVRAAAIRDSRFENQRLLAEVLRAHHEARISTVDEFRTLLDSLEAGLSDLGSTPSATQRERLDSELDAERADLQRYRELLEHESVPSSRLRANLSAHAELQATRQGLLDRQDELVQRLESDQTKAAQNRTLAALDRTIATERDVLESIGETIAAEQQGVSGLYEVFGQVDVDLRGQAYLRVRDRIADLIRVNIDRQQRVLQREFADLQRKARTVARIEYVWSLQDRRRRVGRLNETVRQERLEAALLSERRDDVRTVFGWLELLRSEADRTFAAESELLAVVQAEIYSLVQPTDTTAVRERPTTTAANNTDPATNGGAALSLVVVLFALLALSVVAVVWYRDPEEVNRWTRDQLARFGRDGDETAETSSSGPDEDRPER